MLIEQNLILVAEWWNKEEKTTPIPLEHRKKLYDFAWKSCLNYAVEGNYEGELELEVAGVNYEGKFELDKRHPMIRKSLFDKKEEKDG